VVRLPILRGTFKVSIRRKKVCLYIIHFKLFIYMKLSEPFRVTNTVRPGVVLRPYVFAVYLDDLSLELSNIKAGCYIGEILLNHLTFVDHIYVFCPNVRGL